MKGQHGPGLPSLASLSSSRKSPDPPESNEAMNRKTLKAIAIDITVTALIGCANKWVAASRIFFLVAMRLGLINGVVF